MLVAEWNEKGSNNQSGSVTALDFDQRSKLLYAISAGGVLWNSSLDGLNWNMMNDQLRFNTRFLKIAHPDSNTTRIICAINGKPFYSDDGLEWTIASGPQVVYGGTTKNLKKLEDGKHLFYLAYEGSQRNIKLYHSDNYGRSYKTIYSFGTSDLRNLSIDVIEETNSLYIIEQISASNSRIFEWNTDIQSVNLIQSLSPLSFGADGNGNLRARIKNGTTVFFAFNGSNEYFSSNDLGSSWIKLSDLPQRPWTDGVFVSYEDPDLMILSEVEAHVSKNGGLTWFKINTWPEYYDDPVTKLHADMMFIDEFKVDSTDFIAIANHGGINISYDKTESNISIAQRGLNISQYYSVRTYPNDPNYVFAGSQDQGIQRGYDLNEGPINFDQLFSGDYGHISFTNFGESMWTVYPGGWVFYFAEPTRVNFPQTSYQLDSPDESVWIPPMISSPYGFNAVLLAGGQKDGLPGSHVIELKINDFGNLVVNEWPFDFKTSGGTITGMAYHSFWSNVFYVITSNGRFYLSRDSGQSFEDKSHALNGSHYLYGHDILNSRADANIIYVAGSGYSNSPIFRSTDGGENFESIKYNLPSTTIFDIDQDPTGNFIFAATEAGPYVFIESLEEWFDLSQSKAPNQTYWSVEYIQSLDKVRFGTYGRGIWDLDLNHLSSTSEELSQLDINIFPNPASDMIHIETKDTWRSMNIVNSKGKRVYSNNSFDPSLKIVTSHYPKGIYYIIFESSNSLISKKFIKI